MDLARDPTPSGLSGVQRLLLAVNLSAVAAPRLPWPVFLDCFCFPALAAEFLRGFFLLLFFFSSFLFLSFLRVVPSSSWSFGFFCLVFFFFVREVGSLQILIEIGLLILSRATLGEATRNKGLTLSYRFKTKSPWFRLHSWSFGGPCSSEELCVYYFLTLFWPVVP